MYNLLANYRKTGKSFFLLITFLVMFFFYCFSFPVTVPCALGAQSPKNHSLTISSPDAAYKAAKDYYLKLERDNNVGFDRRNWLNGVRKFRRIYLEQTRGSLAPSALYMMGRMHYKMYLKFTTAIDLENALGYFKDVSTIFPKNSLADDALFNTGEIYLKDKKKQQLAANQYIKVVESYPDGDRYAQSLDRLETLRKETSIKLPEKIIRRDKRNSLVNVLPVKYWSSQDYTRIVIKASSPVHFSSDLLEQTTGQPRRLYLDFEQSYIPPKFRSPVPIEDGLLKQVRTGQFNDSTVRVVLDIESISDYKIFSLNDPFRVVVDVHGNKKKAISNNDAANNTQKRNKKTTLASSTDSTFHHEVDSSFITLRDRKKIKATSKATPLPKTSTKYSLAQQLGLGIRKIVIDPGHGGRDPGAVAFGYKEKNIVLQIAKKLSNVLSTRYGYEVVLTRDTDIFIPLEERTAIANTLNGDLFISIHINAHSDKKVGGIETYFLNLATNAEAMRVAAYENATSTHNINEMQDILSNLMKNSKINESSRLADQVHSTLISGLHSKNYQVRDLGVKQAPFYVLIGAEMPAILAEISFITNPAEAKLLASDDYLKSIATQIAAGVASYVNNHTANAF